MATSEFILAARIKAIDEMSAPLRAMAHNFQGFGERIGAIGAGLRSAAGLGAGIAGASALRTPIEAFAELEQATTRLRVAMMGAGGVVPAQFEEIKRTAMELGVLLPGTTADMMEMAAALRRSTVPVEILPDALRAAAYLRTLLGEKHSFAEVGDMVGKFNTELGLNGRELIDYVDTLQKLKFAFNLDPITFGGSLIYMAGVLRTLNLTGAESAKIIAALAGESRKFGIQKDMFGRYFQMMTSRFAETDKILSGKKNRPIADMLHSAGIDLSNRSFFDEQGKFRGLLAAAEKLNELRQKLNPEQFLLVTRALYGQEANRLVQVMGQLGAEGLRHATSALDAGQASMSDRMKAILGTLTNMWEAFSGTMRNVFAGIGAAWEPELKGMTRLLMGMGEASYKFVVDNKELVRWLTGAALLVGVASAATAFSSLAAALGLASAASALSGIASLVWIPFGAIAHGIGMVAAALRVLVVAAAPGVFAAVGLALGLAAVAAIADWERFQQIVQTLWEYIKTNFPQTGQILKDCWAGVAEFWQGMADKLKGIWQGLVDRITAIPNPFGGLNLPSPRQGSGPIDSDDSLLQRQSDRPSSTAGDRPGAQPIGEYRLLRPLTPPAGVAPPVERIDHGGTLHVQIDDRRTRVTEASMNDSRFAMQVDRGLVMAGAVA